MTKLYRAKGKDPQYWYQKTIANARVLSTRKVELRPKVALCFKVSTAHSSEAAE